MNARDPRLDFAVICDGLHDSRRNQDTGDRHREYWHEPARDNATGTGYADQAISAFTEGRASAC